MEKSAKEFLVEAAHWIMSMARLEELNDEYLEMIGQQGKTINELQSKLKALQVGSLAGSTHKDACFVCGEPPIMGHVIHRLGCRILAKPGYIGEPKIKPVP